MVSADTISITWRNYKEVFETSYFETKPCWIYNNGPRTCRYGS